MIRMIRMQTGYCFSSYHLALAMLFRCVLGTSGVMAGYLDMFEKRERAIAYQHKVLIETTYHARVRYLPRCAKQGQLWLSCECKQFFFYVFKLEGGDVR